MNRTILTAREGYMLTNGEAYGSIIYLANEDAISNWREIPIDEYNKIQAEEEQKINVLS